MITNKGFSLVELLVVVAIFGVLIVVASNFLVATVSTSNSVTTNGEVRQNAVFVMKDIASEVRKAGCVYFDGTLTVADVNGDIASGCANGARVVSYAVNLGDGSIQKVVKVSGSVVTSASLGAKDNIAFVECPVSGGACSDADISTCYSGLDVENVDGAWRKVKISLSVRLKKATKRVDSCANLKLSETVAPRNSGY